MVTYANSVVYKIMSLDPEIDDIYVGSTCAIRKRKHEHKTNCCNETAKYYNRYVYQFIRENCGWDNWSMVVIKSYPDIASRIELLNKEMKWMKKLNATLNKQTPGNWLKLGKTEYDKQYKNDNKETIKAYQLEKIECECGCMISRKHIARHIKTQKHKDRMNNQ